MNRIENYKKLQANMLQTFVDKDSDYGDSFGKTFEKYGIVSALTRMSDKMNRIDNLTNAAFQSTIDDGDTKMRVDESIEDTLLDLANYAMLTYLQIHNFDEDLPKVIEGHDALKRIAEKLDMVQAKGTTNEDYGPAKDAAEFARRQLAVTKAGAKFHWADTNETLELEETADYQAYMNSHESLEDMVNNLYQQLIN